MKREVLRRVLVLISMIILSIAFKGCKSTKKLVKQHEKELREKDSLLMVSKSHQKDSIIITKIKTKVMPVETVVRVPIECDENGNVKPVKYKVKSGNSYSLAEIINNELVIDQRVDSIVTFMEKEMKYTYLTKVDSLTSVIQRLEKQNTNTEKVVQEHWFIAHWKCGTIILILLGALYFVIRYK